MIVTDNIDDMSLHSFTFSPVVLFPGYLRLDSYPDTILQDPCSCPARPSAPFNGHRTSAHLIVHVVEHPIHGREAYSLYYFYDTGRSISRRTVELFAELGLIFSTEPQTITYGFSLTQATVRLLVFRSEVLAMQVTPFSCVCLVCRINYLPARTPILSCL